MRKQNKVIKVDAIETQSRQSIRRSLTILVVFIAAASVIFYLLKERDSTSTRSSQIQLGLPAPDFAFPDLNGQEVSLSDHRGKVVFVNVWATWCPPCISEMPSMQKLYDRLKGESFEILAVSIDFAGREAVAPFMRKLNLTFPALLDPQGSIQPLYGITGVPESFIVDKEGILVEKVIGPMDWADPKILSFFQDLIERPSS